MIAEIEADLIRPRTREGMKAAKAKGRLRGKQSKPSAKQEAHLNKLHATGEYSKRELAELFSVGKSTSTGPLPELNNRKRVKPTPEFYATDF